MARSLEHIRPDADWLLFSLACWNGFELTVYMAVWQTGFEDAAEASQLLMHSFSSAFSTELLTEMYCKVEGCCMLTQARWAHLLSCQHMHIAKYTV